MEFNFEKLVVWQKSILLVRDVYDLISEFPSDEKYALTDQLRRAVISVPSNIAEGYGRASNKDYAHFLSIARGSVYEVITQLRIARELGYVRKEDSENFDEIAAEIVRMLGAMLKKYGAIQESTY